MHPPFPHRLVPSVLFCLLVPLSAACDAGLVTAPAWSAVGGDGGMPIDPEDPALDGREVFESQVLPRLDTECGACHSDDSRDVGFFEGPDPYGTVMGWPDLVAPGDPTASELVTKGVHTGPALTPESQRVIESWILLEGSSDEPDPGDDAPGGGPPGGGGDTRPMAVFTVTASESSPMTLSFDGSPSTDPEGDISLYQWSFGDGASGYGMAVSHTYAEPGSYTVELTVSDRSGAVALARQVVDVGDVGDTSSSGPTVLSLVLIDADSDTEVGAHTPLVSGAVIDREALGTSNFSIRADTTDDADSLRFEVDGVTDFNVENAVPYALSGDSGGDFTAWTPEPGTHTVTAVPYAGPDATGTAGTPVTVTFTVL